MFGIPILTLLGMIPGVGSFITAIVNAFFNAKVEITKAQIGGDAAVATQIVQASVQEQATRASVLKTIAGVKALIYIFGLFLVPLGVYQGKIILIDKLIGPGSVNLFWVWQISWQGTTDPLTGDISNWATSEIGFMFGSMTALTLGHMWFSRKQ